MRRPFLLTAVSCLTAASVYPCAEVYRPGERAIMHREDTIVIWNPATKTEHFVRRAVFAGKGKDFGFLVPTPTQPQLVEVKEAAFTKLENLLPKLKGMPQAAGTGFGSPGGGVTVLHTQRIGKFDAAVLKAGDAYSLANWLKENGYPSRPALIEWVRPYVEKDWVITAYKFARPDGAEKVETSTIRMSFTANQPIYPYREPKEGRDRSESRKMRVFFVGQKGVVGWHAANNTQWPAKQYWSGEIPLRVSDALASDLMLKPKDLPLNSYLTVFDDYLVIRPDTDVVFVTRVGANRERRPTLPYAAAAVVALPLIVLLKRRISR